MIQKNQEYIVEITDLGMDGEGIGRILLTETNEDPAASLRGDPSRMEAPIRSDLCTDGTQEGKAFSPLGRPSSAAGYTVFVKDTVIGDTARIRIIKAKKNYGYGRLIEILRPSPSRVDPVCPHARSCGGCQIMQMEYQAQLEYKENKVRSLLERVGKVSGYEMRPIIGMADPWQYRNKAQFPVGRDRTGDVVTGFYAGRTHAVIDTAHCYIQYPLNDEVVRTVKTWMRTYGIRPYDEKTGEGLVRHILTRVGRGDLRSSGDEPQAAGRPYDEETGPVQMLVCLVINAERLPHAKDLTAKLTEIAGVTGFSINVNRERTNVILGKQTRTLWGKSYVVDTIGEVCYRISPVSFYQVNPVQTKCLYETALEFAGLTGKETVWDLYCGIGTISLFLAKWATKVYGVEIIPEAIEDARENAALNQLENVEFFVGKAEEVLPREYEKHRMHAEVIVVDPPRKGCDAALLECMAAMEPARIVYVSCDPATLARDVNFLGERGYEVKKVQCVDMFPHTVHVETVILLSQRKPDAFVEVNLELSDLDLTLA